MTNPKKPVKKPESETPVKKSDKAVWKPSRTLSSIKPKKISQDEFIKNKIRSNLSLLDFTGIKFYTNRPKPVYIGKRFDGCTFDYTDLEFCEFYDCRFYNCIFTGTRFECTTFTKCYFVRSQFVECDLINTEFAECDFRRAKFYECDCVGGTVFVNCLTDDKTETVNTEINFTVEKDLAEVVSDAAASLIDKVFDNISSDNGGESQ